MQIQPANLLIVFITHKNFKKIMSTRRSFIKQTTLGTLAGLPAYNLANSLFNLNHYSSDELQIHIFSKHLQFLGYKDMCEAAKEMGFDGVDLTVRPKGHVQPEKVAEDLPRATEAMKAIHLLPLMVSTNVKDADNPIDRKVLEVASQLGYKIYRPGWSKYNQEQSIEESLVLFERRMKGLAQLNSDLNISGSYHNHSGNYIGASIWDLAQVIGEIPIEHMGCQYDIMHGTIEGGKNWETDFRRIKNHINSLVIKDFKWEKINGKWKANYVPMGEGMVDFEKYFALLKKYKINVPVSIHVEYDLGGAEKGGMPTIDKKEIFKRIKKDLMFVRKKWELSA
jgi:sugar phosphate isomerase/epimerase